MKMENVPTPSARPGSGPVSGRPATIPSQHTDSPTGAECKRHKIKCDPVDGESKCAKCLRSGTECVPYNMNQRLLDEDAS